MPVDEEEERILKEKREKEDMLDKEFADWCEKNKTCLFDY